MYYSSPIKRKLYRSGQLVLWLIAWALFAAWVGLGFYLLYWDLIVGLFQQFTR